MARPKKRERSKAAVPNQEGKWTHIDGWSESVVEYIRELERMA